MLLQERLEVADPDDRGARVVRPREHRHRDERRVPAVAAARDADARRLAVAAPVRADPLPGVVDVRDDVEALRAVVGVQPRLAVAVAAAHVRLDVDEARVHEELRVRREARRRLGLGPAVELDDDGARVGRGFSPGAQPFGKTHEHRDLRAVLRGIGHELRGHERREVDLGGGGQHPLRERLLLPVPDVARARSLRGLDAERHEAPVRRRDARVDLLRVLRGRAAPGREASASRTAEARVPAVVQRRRRRGGARGRSRSL